MIACIEQPDDLRMKVMQAEREMLTLPQVEMRVVHHFSAGICARELHIPKGTLLTGAIHKFENMNMLSKGDILVLTEDGMKRVTAPATIVSPAGTKRIAYTIEDCIWTTLFATDETDVDKIVAHFTTNSETDYLAFRNQHLIEGE